MSDTDNASLLTNAATLLERYRADERALELGVQCAQTRLEVVRDVIETLSGKPRTRRPRSPRPVEPVSEDAIDAFADAVA